MHYTLYLTLYTIVYTMILLVTYLIWAETRKATLKIKLSRLFWLRYYYIYYALFWL